MEQSKVKAIEINDLRAASAILVMDEVRNEEAHERFDIDEKELCENGKVVKQVKRITIRWYGHVRKIPEERLAKRDYQSSVPGRGRPNMFWCGKWNNTSLKE